MKEVAGGSRKFTVFGGGGFIGSHLAASLRREGYGCWTPKRDDLEAEIYRRPLGHVIYCIGRANDFREKPFEEVEADVCLLKEVLERCDYESLLYLSSTRLYGFGQETAREEDPICLRPHDIGDLYNVAKAGGEALCSATGNDRVRVARLSNVYGNHFRSTLFLSLIVQDALKKKKVTLFSSLDSSKDYVSINDVAKVLPKIALHGKERLYNVASGRNTTHGEIALELKRLTGCSLEVKSDAATVCCPQVETSRLCGEFGPLPSALTGDLGWIVEGYEKFLKRKDD